MLPQAYRLSTSRKEPPNNTRHYTPDASPVSTDSSDSTGSESPDKSSPLYVYGNRLQRQGAFCKFETLRSLSDTPSRTIDAASALKPSATIEQGARHHWHSTSTFSARNLQSIAAVSKWSSSSTLPLAVIATRADNDDTSLTDQSLVVARSRVCITKLLDDNSPNRAPPITRVAADSDRKPVILSLGTGYKKAFASLVPGINIEALATFDSHTAGTHMKFEAAVNGHSQFSGVTMAEFLAFSIQCVNCKRYFSQRSHEFHVFPGPCLGKDGYVNSDFATELALAGVNLADTEPRWVSKMLCEGIYSRFHGIRVFEGITQDEFDFLWVACYTCGRIMTRSAATTHVCAPEELGSEIGTDSELSA